MRVPMIESVQKWKDHFEKMAKGKLNPDSVYNLTMQTGGGGVFGNSKRGNKKIYKIQSGGATNMSDAPIISPVKSALDMSKSQIQQKRKAIKRPFRIRSVSRVKKARRVKTSKKKRRRKSVSVKRRRPKTKKKTTIKKKKKSTPRKKRSRKRDIFK